MNSPSPLPSATEPPASSSRPSSAPARPSLAGYGWMAATITLGTALTAYVRVHPLWAFAVAALLGLSGLL